MLQTGTIQAVVKTGQNAAKLSSGAPRVV